MKIKKQAQGLSIENLPVLTELTDEEMSKVNGGAKKPREGRGNFRIKDIQLEMF